MRHIIIALLTLSVSPVFATIEDDPLTSAARTSAAAAPARPPRRPPYQEHTPFQFPQPYTFELENGMKFVIVPTQQTKNVYLSWGVRAGVGDNDSKPLAHLTEHLVGYNCDESEGFCNAHTTHDATIYEYVLSPSDIPTLFQTTAKQILQTNYSDKLFKNERSAVEHEYYYREGNNPEAQVFRNLFHHLTPEYPHLSDNPRALRTVTPADIAEFQRTWYVPNNMFAVIVGPVDPQQIQQDAEQSLGELHPQELPERPIPTIQPVKEPTIVRYDMVRLPTAVMLYKLPPLGSNEMHKLSAYFLLEEILNDRGHNVLTKAAQDELHQKVYVDAAFMTSWRDFGCCMLMIYADDDESTPFSASPDSTSKVFQKAIDSITPEIFERAYKRLEQGLAMTHDHPEDIINFYNQFLTIGLNPTDISQFFSIFRKATLEDIKSVATNLLKDLPAVIFKNKAVG